MADFVAVLRKTIGGLGDNSPEMREKVYDKARATIEAKLAALNPQPPAVVVERQRKALEDAIAVVKAEYNVPAAPEPDLDDDLEQFFVTPEPSKPESSSQQEDVHAPVETPESADVSTPVYEEPAIEQAAPPYYQPETAQAVPASYEPEPAYQHVAESSHEEIPTPYASEAEDTRTEEYVESHEHYDTAHDHVYAEQVEQQHYHDGGYTDSERHGEFDNDVQAFLADEQTSDTPNGESERDLYEYAATEPKRSRKGLIFGLIAALVLGGAGYAAWVNKDDLLASLPQSSSVEEADSQVAADAQQSSDVQAANEVEAEASAAPTAAQTGPDKYTQRLLPDGNEVDAGPSGAARTIGEGTSLATSAQPGQQETVAPLAPTQNETTSPTAVAPEGPRAIFYEERTNTAQGSAEAGSIRWSVVQESPGANLPPEPAIRADARIPGKDLQLRMTIRRNGDDTLPASHIVEMIFLTPDGFEGGAISNVSRISFKDTEQATGNPLIGIPAKIADGFFLIALGDGPAEVENNLLLLRRENWLDIPIVYQSGRRALLSLEKGTEGEAVFQDALRAWE